MFWARIGRLRHTLALRLTLWYALLFVACAAAAFLLFYMLIDQELEKRIDAGLNSQAARLKKIYDLEGVAMLQRVALLQVQSAGEQKSFLRLLYASGVVFATSNVTTGKNIGIDREAVDHVFETHGALLRTAPLAEGYAVRVLYAQIGPEIILQLGYVMESEHHLLQAFIRLFLLIMLLMLGLAVVVGWFLARRALAGVALITRTAGQISQADLDTRVPVGNRHDEIDGLARTFNQMLDRIRDLVNTMRQMNDNIAHDLRSPLTRIRGLAEVTLTGRGTPEEHANLAAGTIEECDRLLAMIATMLTIARTEAGVEQRDNRLLDFSALVRRACELYQVSAEDRRISLVPQIADGLQIHGDVGMLQRMVANLIDNAIRYTDPRGRVSVTLQRSTGGGVDLEIRDNGIGIAAADQPLVFQRFFRADRSRSQSSFGLGLSLALAVARGHGGDIDLHSRPGQGSAFHVHLP